MDTPSIRKTFLDFFAERGHTVVPSASLVPDDPTLLLTNAGMVQFKPYFLVTRPAPYPRATSVQKCFREKDLEEVGKTARHLTFFEMLGNFSFGDYFKQDACRWAWELMTEGFKLPVDRLWITVFEEDDEAAQIWEKEVGVAPDRVLRRTREQGNFWDMGVAGPCGPCSEILYDRGESFGTTFTGDNELDEERYLEVWNLVFMQYMQDDKFQITGELPNKNVDTGLGLERLASILQDVPTVFEIDSMAAILDVVEQATGKKYGDSATSDVGLRVLSEHARSMTMLIADGVLPGNVGRGYVLRRLIRRAARHARLLGIEELFLSKLTEVVIETYADDYPEVGRNRDLIRAVVEKEEERFDQTLRQGMEILDEEIGRLKKSGGTRLSGDITFKLHDTYGFPLDLTQDIATEEGLEVDRDAFVGLMKQQKTRARAARPAGGKNRPENEALTEIRDTLGKTEFLGYEQLSLDAGVIGILQGVVPAQVLAQGSTGELVLNRTPFYPRGGGQIGDPGEIRTETGLFRVEDTAWGVPGVVIHSGTVVQGEIRAGQDCRATVDPVHREGVTQAHTSTHILHWTLHQTLGEHAKQMGSLVEPGRLRFDFNHYEPVHADKLAEIEEAINRRSLWDDPVRAFETTYDHATSIGAMALFGEKYGEHVRVVEVGDYSKELCGGTHVARTGNIGLVKLVHEGSVAAGIRRVEALTGWAGFAYLNNQAEKLKQVADRLKTDPEKVLERLDKTLENLASLQSQLNQQAAQGAQAQVKEILSSDALQDVDGHRMVISLRKDASVDDLRKLATALRDELGSGVVVVGSTGNGKANLVAAASKDLVGKGVSSSTFVSMGAKILGGGGGGKPDMAVAGGPNPDQIEKALEAVGDEVRRTLQELS
ncbi:MAG TPA: alanine--tRNA ligase [Actinomycetota bacterium]|nr:alanine--tRNA ligase [Actinomycetota bacterium]